MADMDEDGPAEDFGQNEEDFLAAKIDNISVSNLGFIVFLKVHGDARTLPIFIGANEAQSIAIAYNNQTPPRPLTHDLMKSILGLLDVEVVKIQVTSLSDNTFFGRIHLRKEGIVDMDVDARPSDAIALALRYHVPVYVHKDVFESAAIMVKDAEAGGESPDETGAETDAEAAGEPKPVPAKLPAPQSQMSQMERIKEKLKKALAVEHYEEAARLRDELKRIESGN